jgi:type VI secretion system protein ImpH
MQRQPSTGLIDQLIAEPYRFEFFQAVRLVELWLGGQDAQGDVQELPEALHFANSVALAFPAGEIEALKLWLSEEANGPQGETPKPARIEITPTFMSLLGAHGTLPLVYSELIGASKFADAARGFLDLFTDRLVGLFYLAWKKNRPHFHHETRFAADQKNPFLDMLLSLSGLGQHGLQERLRPDQGGVDDESLAYFAGAIQPSVLSAAALENILNGYFCVPIQIEQFVGRWLDLPKPALWKLGQGVGILGSTTLPGERIWQRDLGVRVVLGPLNREQFERFLPGSAGALALQELITSLSGVSLEVEVQLTLSAKAVQGFHLNTKHPEQRSRLGWDTYIRSEPETQNRRDVRYALQKASRKKLAKPVSTL